MINTIFRGADSLVKTLQQAGVEKIFSLSGNHIMSIYDALHDTSIQLFHVRHEAAAVHMAEAYARMSGKVGVALVTGGPGHANALGALYTARQNETPLILLSGHAPLSQLGHGAFQEMDQVAIAAPLTKASWMVDSSARLAPDLARAFRLALEGRPGPVHLSLPSDCLEQPVENPGIADFMPIVTPLAPNIQAALHRHLARAARPLIILPPALCTERGLALCGPILGQGMHCVPMMSPRGLNDPALGNIKALVAQADLIVLIGKALDFTLDFGTIGSADWIIIDSDETIRQRAHTRLGAKLILCAEADATLVLEGLSAHAVTPTAAQTAWLVHAKAMLAFRPPHRSDHNGLDSATMCTHIAQYIQTLHEPVFVCDGGEIGQWAQSLIQTPARLINGVAGAIGAAIPFALGAKAAAPHRPVLAVMGDGTFGFHMAEFETGLRHDLPFVAVIGNDGRWNAEYQIQKRAFGASRAFGCTLLPGTNYDAAIKALGCHGEQVTTAEEIAPALDRAFASRKPACVNILIEGLPAPRLGS